MTGLRRYKLITNRSSANMNNLITINLGTPKHGWLPVNFRYREFHLEFDASDVLNDPVADLYHLIIHITDNGPKEIIWWLEPAAYLFTFNKDQENIILTITETSNLHNANATKIILTTIVVEAQKMLASFRKAIKDFYSQTWTEEHWPHSLDKNKIKNL